MNPITADLSRLRMALEVSEDRRRFPYLDTEKKLTIGVGRNLSNKGLHDDEIDLMLTNDINEAIGHLDAKLPWWRDLDAERQAVMIEMCFNMGIGNPKKGLLSFINTLEAVRTGRWDDAADGMLASKWARQVKGRAILLADIMRTGKRK